MSLSGIFCFLSTYFSRLQQAIWNKRARLDLSTGNRAYLDVVTNFSGTMEGIAKGLQIICYSVSVLAIVYGANLYAIGSDETIHKAKRRWVCAIGGIIVAVLAFMIRDYAKSKASSSGGF